MSLLGGKKSHLPKLASLILLLWLPDSEFANSTKKCRQANYGDRYRYGERIASGFVESAVNQVVAKRFEKKQQMCWTQQGAHLLLQVRVKVLDGKWRETFCGWYPGMTPQETKALWAARTSAG